ncbi:hypothetical protein GQ53DRAFT_527200 [Thozetella sp. PMI_491]|nr:hypothetical protein GQ53DRAFT_527200 [Thozetella sp. PMI_491]
MMGCHEPPSRSSTIRSDSSSTYETTAQVLRKKYKDPVKLREGLDRMLGEGNYSLKLRNNRYILSSYKLLSQEELAELEECAYQHYDPF